MPVNNIIFIAICFSSLNSHFKTDHTYDRHALGLFKTPILFILAPDPCTRLTNIRVDCGYFSSTQTILIKKKGYLLSIDKCATTF